MQYFLSMSDAFNLFATCYVYGCLALVFLLFIGQAYSGLSFDSSIDRSIGDSGNDDFYSQVKDLLNPTEELNLAKECDRNPLKASSKEFEALTIRELRTYIKDNQLHHLVRDRLGTSVSNARKAELIGCLNSI